MASSNIKLFDENKGNMLTDTEFNISTQRLNGLQTGVASSQLQNKAMYQASLVAYAIAQIMLQNGLNANDTDAVSAFVANLSSTMLQKVHDIATTEEAQAGTATGKWMSPALTKAFFDYRKATTAEAQEGVNDVKWMSPALVKAAIDVLAAKAQNILSDVTKSLYGLRATATPDDVFAKLAMPYGNYGFDVTTVLSDGTPVPFVVLNGLKDISGKTAITDKNGRCSASMADSKTLTVTISDYIGVAATKTTISAEDDVVFTPVTITLERDTSMHLIQTSKTLKVLHGVPIDMCIVGGGASGSYYESSGAWPGGGGGYVTNILGVVLTEPAITLTVGAGGRRVAGSYGAGGDTSVEYNGIVATAKGAANNVGNGNGGSSGSAGANGTVHVFNDESLPLPGGGGGGGNNSSSTAYPGGLDFGGKGGWRIGPNNSGGPSGGRGPGGGGGGGTGSGPTNFTFPGEGGAGGLYIRVNAPEVSV